MAEGLPGSLQTALTDLARWFGAAQTPAMIIGGVAASVLGRPRLTQGIDVLAIMPETHWARAISEAASYGFVPRIDGALEFARRSRVLLLRHSDSAINLDMALGSLPFEEAAIGRSTVHDVGGVRVRLPRVEDLLVMKAIAGRPKDLEDMRGLLAAHPRADFAEARRWINEFATAAGRPDMLEEFDRLRATCSS